MKAIKYFVMVISAVFLFAGCGGNQVKVPGNENSKIRVSKEENLYIFYWNYNPYKGMRQEKSSESVKETYKKVFHEITTVGLKQGYSYAAIVNNQFNNLSGYPINDWNAMSKFIDLYGKKHYKVSFSKALAKVRRPEIKVIYFKKRPKGMFVWDLKQLKADTDKYAM